MKKLWSRLKIYLGKSHIHLKDYNIHYIVCWFWVYSIAKMLLLFIQIFNLILIWYSIWNMQTHIVDAGFRYNNSQFLVQFIGVLSSTDNLVSNLSKQKSNLSNTKKALTNLLEEIRSKSSMDPKDRLGNLINWE